MISGVSSTSSPSLGSGEMSKVKASDWIKSLNLKTPTKEEQNAAPRDTEDSAKKKKKFQR